METLRSATVQVLGSGMHSLEVGAGPAVLLVHGNPTSSFLWRHMMARAAEGADPHRWIAVDLIGMGRSDKPALGYRFADHAAYLEGFITALDLSDVVVIGHDWGVALALDLLNRRPDLVRAVGFMEGHLRPLSSWASFDEGGRDLFQRLRTPGVGERMVLVENFFLDTLLPAALIASLTQAELAAYQDPYPDPASRRPLLQWAREIPVGTEPADTADRLALGWANLRSSPVPKLVVHGTPGVLVTPAVVATCRHELDRLTVADVGGPAGHFLPEDRPVEVADAVLQWVSQLT